jgi:UDP-GlcNAc:undecaprenyl-phosphate GlcNAc-1-phosphate transferase
VQLSLQDVLLSFVLAFLASALLTPVLRKFALAIGVVDKPNQSHKTHSEPVPYLGGISIVLTVALGLASATYLKSNQIGDLQELVVLMSAPLILALVGLVDDFKNLGAFSRLFVQSISALVVALVFLENGWYGEPTYMSILNFSITAIWIVGITNSFNFIDNLDGGAGGIALISATTLAAAAFIGNQLSIASISILIAGATLGFLMWNLYPARIYLGDAGALFIGAILAILTIRLDPETANPVSGWVFALLLFAVPILDTSVAVISRIYRGFSPIQGGRDHLSHRLLNLGYSKKLTALTIWLLQIYFSALGLLLFAADERESLVVEGLAGMSWVLLLALFLRLSPITVYANRDDEK